MGKLAATFSQQGRWKEAEKLEVEVVEMGKRILGLKHQFTLASMNNLASTYHHQRRWKEAEKLLIQAVEIGRVEFGEDHPSTIAYIASLAAIRQAELRHESDVKVVDGLRGVLGGLLVDSVDRLWHKVFSMSLDGENDIDEGLQRAGVVLSECDEDDNIST
ncbi:hypothetical protein BDD12DRAFT_914106 [Trichophaea hybrida]|nr:hypothetical protein BDD12DRAFT_914106 [Trichophaea hybrida]